MTEQVRKPVSQENHQSPEAGTKDADKGQIPDLPLPFNPGRSLCLGPSSGFVHRPAVGREHRR